jgi:hypothetical protein
MDFWQKILDWLRGLFGGETGLVGEVPAPVIRKVEVIIFDPRLPLPGNQRLSQFFGWQDADALIPAYIADLQAASHGYLSYQIVQRTEVDGFPVKKDGFVYTPEEYRLAWETGSGFHQPDQVDYERVLNDYGLISRINSGVIDEVWLFGMPYAGFYESIMVGSGAFFCNAPPHAIPGVSRLFIIMGFNYERGVGEMLESFGHRAESILNRVFRKTISATNLWERFTRYEKKYPGQAECGTVHFAPNSQNDYDWGNPTPVPSRCRNWTEFPDLSGAPVLIDKDEWGGGDIRLHHLWWLGNFPHITGSSNGIAYNWWKYIVDPNQVN